MDLATLTRWERELLEIQARVERQLVHVRALLADLSVESPPASPADRTRSSTINDRAADATYILLAELGTPTNRQYLYERIVAQGFEFGGKNPINTYGAILSRDERFTPIGARGSWGLSEWEQRGTAPIEESRPSLSSDAAVPESVDGPALDAGGLPSPSGFDPPLRYQEGDFSQSR